jgi:hypothetical protein
VQRFERPGQAVASVGFPRADPLVRVLEAPLALDQLFRFVEFVRDGEGRVFPIDLMYGVPSASLALCQHAIEAIQAGDLLSPSRKEQVQEATATIGAALDEFVKTWSCGIGHPVRALSAIDGNLQWI